MSEVIPFDKGNVPAGLGDFVGGLDSDDLSAGVSGGFSVISVRGSKWRIKAGGDDMPMLDSAGEAMPSIRVVILKANNHVSKNYYEGAYSEGVSDAPSCFSLDGVKPDASVENPVHDNCAACPYNQFGSRITDSGSKAKKCADSRRIAVVPEGDYANERYNGPMLLRIPATSLRSLSEYAKDIKAKGYPYNTVVTRIGFDPDVSYPKLKFTAARPLSQDEADEVMGLLGQPAYLDTLNAVLAEAVEVNLPAEKPEALVFEDDEPEEKPKKEAKKAEPKPEPEVVEEPPLRTPDSTMSDNLDDILSKLDELD